MTDDYANVISSFDNIVSHSFPSTCEMPQFVDDVEVSTLDLPNELVEFDIRELALVLSVSPILEVNCHERGLIGSDFQVVSHRHMRHHVRADNHGLRVLGLGEGQAVAKSLFREQVLLLCFFKHDEERSGLDRGLG